MAPSLFGFFFFFILQHPLYSNANLHKTNLFRSLDLSHQHPQSKNSSNQPKKSFEVTAPIKRPSTMPCSTLVLQHRFGSTLERPPVTAPYSPPADCPSQNFSKIILHWRANCKGRQFDRILGIWLGGAELLRSCTAEPTANGIYWSVEKDITKYSSLLKTNQTLAVYLGNIVDDTYTGIYNVEIWFHFYPVEETQKEFTPSSANPVPGFDSPADLIVPISRNLPLNDGLWFLVNNHTDIQTKEFEMPRNAYRAVLEVYVSFHGDDEFWYTNPSEDYLITNKLDGVLAGNGPFREIVVSLDGNVVGAVWPFTVIHTGGINPLLWKPITAIGSFNLPSYDIEITPFLGDLLDGKSHEFEFSVTDALDVWFVDANLHLWLDEKSEKTEGKLIKYSSAPLSSYFLSSFQGYNGKFLTSATRTISSTGWVKSSHGKIPVSSSQKLYYKNLMTLEDDGNVQILNQTIKADYEVHAKHPSSGLHSAHLSQRFPLNLYTVYKDEGDGLFSSTADIFLGFSEDRISGERFSSLSTNQTGEGLMLVKGLLVQSGSASTQQVYSYHGPDGCFYRNVSSTNSSIVHDKVRVHCKKGSKIASDLNEEEDWN